MKKTEALANYRAARAAYNQAAAAATRLANEADYRLAELAWAQNLLWQLDIDPWHIDDADGVERTPV